MRMNVRHQTPEEEGVQRDAPERSSALSLPSPVRAPESTSLEEQVAGACKRIPPLWTLRNFVAVNPFLGFTDAPFLEAMGRVERLFHGRALMPRAFFEEQQRRGRIGDQDVEAALRETEGRPGAALATGSGPRAETLSDAADRSQGTSWGAIIRDEVARWCAGRFDAGQAAWRQPGAELPPFRAWKEAACVDRSPELRGLAGFRSYVASLPDAPLDAIGKVLEQLEVPADGREEYLTRALASVAGWAGHVQGRVREASFAGHTDTTLHDLLAIRLAFEGALQRALDDDGAGLVSPPASAEGEEQRAEELESRHFWQLAYEAGYRRRLLSRLGRGPARPRATTERPRLQAVFCIDVRSELFRRNLEARSSRIQTLGFAGFFGVALEYLRTGQEQGAARCPVLLSPPHRLREQGAAGSGAERRMRRARRRHDRFTAMRKMSVGAYPLVETVGHFFGLRLLTDSLGWTRPRQGGALFPSTAEAELAPSLRWDEADGTGLRAEDRVDVAEGMLRNMSLTDGFAEVVLLCGHGSTSTNNPYASSLDCGACGGHAGDVNARVAAELLNDPAVRLGLAERGIQVPDDTRFVAGLHDTTGDRVTLFGADAVPEERRALLETWLEAAGAATRADRAGRLGERSGPGLGRRIRQRSRDWSEVRPEWALAGNAAFVAAPRDRTRGLDLQGRVFLHDYDPEVDTEGSVLELILTAPLVVASWINLQYYASSVDNDTFGSGDKTLHNVVGRHGVMLGNRSDLQVGLPWQSVHDGRDYAHEPMRLNAVIEAPRERIAAVIGAHPELRELLENGWVHLLAWDAEQGSFHRWRGGPDPWMPEAAR